MEAGVQYPEPCRGQEAEVCLLEMPTYHRKPELGYWLIFPTLKEVVKVKEKEVEYSDKARERTPRPIPQMR